MTETVSEPSAPAIEITPVFSRDEEGRLICHRFCEGKIVYDVRLYNHRSWVQFELGKPTAYGVILKTRRRHYAVHEKLGIHRFSYIFRQFGPGPR